jgi:hypothetical protein
MDRRQEDQVPDPKESKKDVCFFKELVEVYGYVETGQKTGNVVITM